MAIEDVIIEKPGVAQESPDAGSSLHGEAGIDRTGDDGSHLSASATLNKSIDGKLDIIDHFCESINGASGRDGCQRGR